MRLVFPLALVAVAIGLLANQVAGAGTLLDPANLRHEMKLSYCLEQRGKRFYRTENLEDLCTLKVAFFDDLVSEQRHYLCLKSLFALRCQRQQGGLGW